MRLLTLFLFLPALAFGQGLPIKSGASSDLASVNANKALLVSMGISTRPTYTISANGLTTTAAYSLQVEASAGTGYKLLGWCIGVSNATAAAAITVTVNRRSTASTSGTQCVAEQSASCSMSKADPTDADFGGTARATATMGTIGAMLDSIGFQIGELSAGGTADSPGPPPFCRWYGLQGEKMPTVAAGTSNGISVAVSSMGAGALASGSITMYVIQE